MESPPDYADLLEPEIESLPRREATQRLLALAAAREGHDWSAATVGRSRRGPTMSCLAAPSAGEARVRLAELVAVDAKVKKSTAELKAIVLARDSLLMELRGVGPVVAARV